MLYKKLYREQQLMSELGLKEGYKSVYDSNKGLTHIYPEKGRKHLFDKCWCSPITNKKNKTISHRESKENKVKCDTGK